MLLEYYGTIIVTKAFQCIRSVLLIIYHLPSSSNRKLGLFHFQEDISLSQSVVKRLYGPQI